VGLVDAGGLLYPEGSLSAKERPSGLVAVRTYRNAAAIGGAGDSVDPELQSSAVRAIGQGGHSTGDADEGERETPGSPSPTACPVS